MKKYKYNQFSFAKEGNEEILSQLLLGVNDTPLAINVINIVGKFRVFHGLFKIVRVFQWSNGNVTVIGHVL